jgi:hypothetical protein
VVNRNKQFDREYCHAVKSACLQAIANTSFCDSAHPGETIIPAAEISVALIDIMGSITAMVDDSRFQFQSLLNEEGRCSQSHTPPTGVIQQHTIGPAIAPRGFR